MSALSNIKEAGRYLASALATGIKATSPPYPSAGSGGIGGGSGWNGRLDWGGRAPGARYDYKSAVGLRYDNSAVLAVLQWQWKAFIKAPPVVKRMGSDGKDETVKDHPFLDLLREPMGEDGPLDDVDLWISILMAQSLGGAGYLLIESNGLKRPKRLRPLPWQSVIPVRAKPDEFISYYAYQVDGRTWKLPAETVVRLPFGVDPLNGMGGLAPLGACDREIATDNELSTGSAATARNLGITSVVFSPDPALFKDGNAEEMPKDVADAIKEEYDKRVGDNRGQSLVARFPIRMEKAGYSPKELGFDELHDNPESRICAALNISPIVVGLRVGASPTYSNYETAVKASYTYGIIPLHILNAKKLTRQLMARVNGRPNTGKGREWLEFDSGEVPELQEDKAEKAGWLDDAVKAGWLEPDEAREEMGLPPMVKRTGPAPAPAAADGGVLDVTQEDGRLSPERLGAGGVTPAKFWRRQRNGKH